jgi:predicted DNA-binding transcriptional regulator AlpA
MDEELISKKELLALTGISYGQLYRWKRKGLIPEDWFIRKSTYTGQETFFPRSQMLTRVGRILNMKEDASLDDLADVFSPEPGPSAPPTAEALEARGIVSADVMKLFMDDRDATPLSFDDALHAYLFGQALVSGELSLDEGRLMLDTLRTAAIKFGAPPAQILLTRKLGVFGCVALAAGGSACPDRDTRLVRAFDLKAAAEELKLKLV